MPATASRLPGRNLVTRRPDPLRLYLSHRASLTRRLVGEGAMGRETAERWLAAWERQARRTGLNSRTLAFWDGAWAWIAEERLRDS